ncbi:hypothetical protein [Aliikangiella sp. IMCC44632]
MKLYWVETIDHGEDWFIAANDQTHAITIFSEELGFDIEADKVSAEFICNFPASPQNLEPGFCDNDDLIQCGGEFIDFHDQDLLAHVTPEFLHQVAGETRIVRFGKRVFMEGNILRVALQIEGKLSQS